MPHSLRLFRGLACTPTTFHFSLNGTYVTSPLANFHPMYMNQWNLSIQRQMGKDWLVTANYVGNSTIHMISGEDINPAVFLGLGPCTIQTATGPVNYSTLLHNGESAKPARPALAKPGSKASTTRGIGTVDDGGTAEYEGLYLSAQKRLSHGVTAQANYTWSHCISDVYNGNPGATGVAPPTIAGNGGATVSGIDLRQQFVLNLVATTPRFSNRTLRIVGEQLAGRADPRNQVRRRSSVFSAGTDQALTTVANQTPNLVNANPYPANQTVNNWINASAFAPAALGTYGNLGYNNLKGPGIFQLNVALSRTFPIGEKRTIQLRAEAFNLPNHLNAFLRAPTQRTSRDHCCPKRDRVVPGLLKAEALRAKDEEFQIEVSHFHRLQSVQITSARG